MHTVEAETRRQTMSAQQVYRELDGPAGAFAHAGGRLLIFSGMPSEKVFPDDALEAFGTLQVCIIEEDLPLLRQDQMHCLAVEKGH